MISDERIEKILAKIQVYGSICTCEDCMHWFRQIARESAEAMRERCASECEGIADDWFQAPEDNESVLACQTAGDCAEAIRNLPLDPKQ